MGFISFGGYINFPPPKTMAGYVPDNGTGTNKNTHHSTVQYIHLVNVIRNVSLFIESKTS